MSNYYDNGKIIYGGPHTGYLCATDKLADRYDNRMIPAWKGEQYGRSAEWEETRLLSAVHGIIQRTGIRPLTMSLERFVEIHGGE